MSVEHAAGEPVARSKPSRQRTMRAAAMATERNTTHMDMPVLGRVELPPADQLAFMGGIITLAAVGMIEWPVAIVLTAGHLLAHNRHVQILRDFGKALEEA
jgi:hypothetical protein